MSASSAQWRIVGCRLDAAVIISKLELWSTSAKLDDGITPISTIAPDSGSLAALTDGDAGTTCGFDLAAMHSPGFSMVWSFAAAVSVAQVVCSYSGGLWRSATVEYFDGTRWQVAFDFLPGATVDPVYFDRTAIWTLDFTLADIGMHGHLLSQKTAGATQYWSDGHFPYTRSAQFGPSLSGANPSLINIADGIGAFGTGDFELGLWLNLNSAAGDYYGRIVESKLFGTLGGWNLVQVEKLSRIMFHLSDGTRLLEQNLPAGWNYIEVRRKAGTIGLLINGTLLQSASSSHDFSAADIAIGGNLNGLERIAGLINEVSISKGSSRAIATYALPADTNPWPRDRRLYTATAHSHVARDMEFGGPGTITGQTLVKDGGPEVPTRARVRLLRARDAALARETWSDPATGAYSFAGLDTATPFVALAQKPDGAYEPVAGGPLTPQVP